MSFVLNSNAPKLPHPLLDGKHASYMEFSDSKTLGAVAWSDDAFDTHGILYPTDFATTEQTLLNNQISAMNTEFGQDDDVYADQEVKQKVIDCFSNGITHFSRLNLSNTPTIDTEKYSGTDATTWQDICKLDTDKFVVIYRNSTDSDIYGVVATVSGSTITFGSAQLITAGTITRMLCVQLTTDKFVAQYADGSGIKAKCCTVSGTTITAGTEATIFASGDYHGLDVIDSGTFVSSVLNSGNPEGVISTVSGTTISSGSAVSYSIGGNGWTSCRIACIDSDKLAMMYTRGTSDATAVVFATFSGTTIGTWGDVQTLENTKSDWEDMDIIKISAGKALCAYRGASAYGYATVVTFDGTDSAKGTEVTFESSSVVDIGLALRASDSVVVCYNSSIQTLVVSGTTVTAGGAVSTGANGTYERITFIDTDKLAMTFSNSADSSYGYGAVFATATVDVALNGTAIATSQAIFITQQIDVDTVLDEDRIAYLSITNDSGSEQTITIESAFLRVI